MIQVTDVTKMYPAKNKDQSVSALQGVSLEVKRGDIFGIVGHSGAGKSTLLRLFNGLEAPTSGTVMVDGKEISRLNSKELRQARQKIGMIFQHFHLLWSRTVRENIAFPLEVAGKSKQEIKQKVDQLLERVGLSERGDAYPSQLSGGQKQRVGIARALANDPDIVLCDEATSALDPETTSSILNLLKEIHREMGITLILITHEMSVVKAICNKMAVMEDGKVVEMGEVSTIFKQPQHPVTKQFVKELSLLTANEAETKTGTTVRINPSKLTVLKKIAEEYQVSFKVLHGEITAFNNYDWIQLKVIGDEIKVQQAMTELEAEVNPVV